ncbi:IclR family transcriptional regulator [Chelatococcus sp.]|uniref:IclR family transcriptional regulator n=1 Tax=Chelatococcus sp. TaxID=1953771 RepID=UPI001BCED0EC|nr:MULTISPECIES: IclR family transcriptional regulator [unclassified Chelatococcus]MBS7699953.1 IclR family transcriptional regulator [Chelatococcus sp. YT9]MBX3558622.1 IclR family transcriptional regulator [Chelatococcus sp.]
MARSVTRALSIFDAFDSDHVSLSLQDIAERTPIAKATAFRLVNTLENEGYLVRLQNGQYVLSMKLVRLAGLVQGTLTAREAARSTMIELSKLSGETITLNARAHHERMVIEVVDTPSPLMAISRSGERVPILFGAAGRVLLAFMAERERGDLLDAIGAARLVKLSELRADLNAIRIAGIAVTSGTRVPGLTAIAVPLFEQGNIVQYSLTLSGPAVRVDSRIPELSHLMQEAGNRISSKLGGESFPYPGVGPTEDAAGSQRRRPRR